MHKQKRQQAIRQALRERNVVTVQELTSALKTSPATIRRDIIELAEREELIKIHGGAQALSPPASTSSGNLLDTYQQTDHLAEKRAIADLAVSMCDEDEAIIINGGTTTYQMVHGLRSRTLQVLTNSLPIAAYLFEYSRVRLQVPGGEVYRDEHIILSPFDNDTIRNYHGAKLFMGAQSLTSSGLLERDPRLIQAERKLLSQADELIVLVDSAKFRRKGSLILCPLDDIDTVITDDGVRPEDVEMLQRADIDVRIATTGSSQRVA